MTAHNRHTCRTCHQARLVDTAQAERVRLAIRWGVHPDDVSERRAMESATERLLRDGEDVLGWLP